MKKEYALRNAERTVHIILVIITFKAFLCCESFVYVCLTFVS